MIIDFYSRYVVGWMVAHREQDALVKRLIKDTCIKQKIKDEQLTIYAGRGPNVRSKACGASYGRTWCYQGTQSAT